MKEIHMTGSPIPSSQAILVPEILEAVPGPRLDLARPDVAELLEGFKRELERTFDDAWIKYAHSMKVEESTAVISPATEQKAKSVFEKQRLAQWKRTFQDSFQLLLKRLKAISRHRKFNQTSDCHYARKRANSDCVACKIQDEYRQWQTNRRPSRESDSKSNPTHLDKAF